MVDISHWSGLGLNRGSLSSGTVEGMMAKRKTGELLGGRNGIFATASIQLATLEKKTLFSPTDCLRVGKSHKITNHASWPSGNSPCCHK